MQSRYSRYSENMGTKIRNTIFRFRTNTGDWSYGAPPPWTVVFLSGVVTLNWPGIFSLQTCLLHGDMQTSLFDLETCLLALCRTVFLCSEDLSLTSCRPLYVFWSQIRLLALCWPVFWLSAGSSSIAQQLYLLPLCRTASGALQICLMSLCRPASGAQHICLRSLCRPASGARISALWSLSRPAPGALHICLRSLCRPASDAM